MSLLAKFKSRKRYGPNRTLNAYVAGSLVTGGIYLVRGDEGWGGWLLLAVGLFSVLELILRPGPSAYRQVAADIQERTGFTRPVAMIEETLREGAVRMTEREAREVEKRDDAEDEAAEWRATAELLARDLEVARIALESIAYPKNWPSNPRAEEDDGAHWSWMQAVAAKALTDSEEA